jgi:hypothetical protein
MKKNTWVQMRVSPKQKDEWLKKSEKEGLSLSMWITKKLNKTNAKRNQSLNKSNSEGKNVN